MNSCDATASASAKSQPLKTCTPAFSSDFGRLKYPTSNGSSRPTPHAVASVRYSGSCRSVQTPSRFRCFFAGSTPVSAVL